MSWKAPKPVYRLRETAILFLRLLFRGRATVSNSDRTQSEIGLESETLRTGVRNSSPKVNSDWRLGIELRIGLGLTTPDSGLESEIMHNSGLRTPVRNPSPKVNSDSVRNSSPKVNSDWRLGIELRIGLGLTTPDSGLESEIGSQLRTPDSSPKSQSEKSIRTQSEIMHNSGLRAHHSGLGSRNSGLGPLNSGLGHAISGLESPNSGL